MTTRLTRTQLLAQSVKANVVFFRFGNEETGADPIVAVCRDEAAIETFCAVHGRAIQYPGVYWQELPLQGPDMPYRTWPNLETLFLVTEGGIGDVVGDTNIDPVALAVFVDKAGAEVFAKAEGNPNVVVRQVPLDSALPIPSAITGDPLLF